MENKVNKYKSQLRENYNEIKASNNDLKRLSKKVDKVRQSTQYNTKNSVSTSMYQSIEPYSHTYEYDSPFYHPNQVQKPKKTLRQVYNKLNDWNNSIMYQDHRRSRSQNGNFDAFPPQRITKGRKSMKGQNNQYATEKLLDVQKSIEEQTFKNSQMLKAMSRTLKESNRAY